MADIQYKSTYGLKQILANRNWSEDEGYNSVRIKEFAKLRGEDLYYELGMALQRAGALNKDDCKLSYCDDFVELKIKEPAFKELGISAASKWTKEKAQDILMNV